MPWARPAASRGTPGRSRGRRSPAGAPPPRSPTGRGPVRGRGRSARGRARPPPGPPPSPPRRVPGGGTCPAPRRLRPSSGSPPADPGRRPRGAWPSRAGRTIPEAAPRAEPRRRRAKGSPTGPGSACSCRSRWGPAGSSPGPGGDRGPLPGGRRAPRTGKRDAGRTPRGPSRATPVAPEQVEEERRPGHRRDCPHGEFPRGGRRPGDGVGEDEERPAEEERRREEPPVSRAYHHPRPVRDDEPDEADETRDRHHRSRQEGGREVRGRLHPLHGEPRLEGGLVSQQQEVQSARQEQQHGDPQGDIGEQRRHAAGRPEPQVPHQPVERPRYLPGRGQGDHQQDDGVEERPHDDPHEDESLGGNAAPPAREEEYRECRQRGPDEGEKRQAGGGFRRQEEGHGERSHRGPPGNPEDVRVCKRVAQQRLERDAGRGQGPAHQGPEQGAGEAKRQEDAGRGVVPPVQQGIRQLPERDRDGSGGGGQRQGAEERRDQRRKDGAAPLSSGTSRHGFPPLPRAGVSALPSRHAAIAPDICSSAATRRGPGRVTMSPSRVTTEPSRKAGISFQRVTSSGNLSTPAIPATNTTSGRRATRSSTERRGYRPARPAATFRPPESRTSSSMNVPAPAAMTGDVDTAKRTRGAPGPSPRPVARARSARRRSAAASASPRPAASSRTPTRRMAANTASRSGGETAKQGPPISARARPFSRGLPSVVHNTRSGERAMTRSTSGSLTPPTFGKEAAAGGKLQYRVTPARASSRPRRKTISVRLGARETTRRGGASSRTVAPRSSFMVSGKRSPAAAGEARDWRKNAKARNCNRALRGTVLRQLSKMISPAPPPFRERGGGWDARPLRESSRPFSRERRLGICARRAGLLASGFPAARQAAFLLSAPSRPPVRRPGSGFRADFVTGYSCGAAMDSHHLPLRPAGTNDTSTYSE